MNCDDVRARLDAFLDGEMSCEERGEIRGHIHDCSACRAEARKRCEVRERLSREVSCAKVPDALKARIAGCLEGAQVAGCSKKESERSHFAWLSLAASALVAGAGSLALLQERPAPTETVVAGVTSVRSPTVAQARSWHRRVMPLEVVGPDGAEVESWFSSRVGFDVSLPEFDPLAVHLLGGRLGSLGSHEAAGVVYSVGGEKFTLMLFDPLAFEAAQSIEEGRVYLDNAASPSVALGIRQGIGFTATGAIDDEALLQLMNQVSWSSPAETTFGHATVEL